LPRSVTLIVVLHMILGLLRLGSRWPFRISIKGSGTFSPKNPSKQNKQAPVVFDIYQNVVYSINP